MKRFAVAAVWLAGLALAAGEAGAQTGTARGKVLDEKGQPVVEAVVTLDFQGGVTRKYETKTNKKGEFTQVGISPGQYRVTANKEGYAPVSFDARIQLGDPTYLADIKLIPAAQARAAAAAADPAMNLLKQNFAKAIELTQADKLDEAEVIFKEIAAKHPSVPEVQYNLGYIYTKRKDWAQAEAAYKQALTLKPDYSEAKVALARVYQDSGQSDKAMALMSESGEDPKVLFNLGVMHFNGGKLEEAQAAFKKVQSLDPSNAESHYFLGTIALNQGNTAEAIANLEKYLSLNPTNAQFKQTAEGLVAALKPKK